MLTRRRRTHNFFTRPDRGTTLYKADGLMQPRKPLYGSGGDEIDGLIMLMG